MKYRDTYRIVTRVSRYVSHRDFRYRATPNSFSANQTRGMIGMIGVVAGTFMTAEEAEEAALTNAIDDLGLVGQWRRLAWQSGS